MNKSTIVVALLALVVGFALFWFVERGKPVALEAGTWFGDQARALPAFELVDHRQRKLNNASLKGKWNLIFFGYTHCPDICPMSLQTLREMKQAIDDPDVTEALGVYFVSVDPERDTPQVLADYVTYFDADFIGASADMEQLRKLTAALGIAHEYRNRAEGSDSYDVDHSGAIVLISPEVEYAGLFGAPHDALAMARDMTKIVEHN